MIGSTDNSESVIKKWHKENQSVNLKYYKKQNGGLSSARNYGVEKAEGKYIMFLDSDDCIASYLFKNLHKYIEQEIDIIKYKMLIVNEIGEKIEKISGPVFEKCTGEEAFEKLVGMDNFLEVACVYLYKRDFFVRNNFKYNEVNKYHEDFGLTPLVIVNAKTFISTDVYGYLYNQTENSITRNEDYNKTLLMANDVLCHYDNMVNRIDKYLISKKTKDLLRKYYTNSVILKASELKGRDRKKYFKEIRKRKMYKNIKPINVKQAIKRVTLFISLNLYIKMR